MKRRLPTGLYYNAREFERLMRAPDTSLRERAALEQAMIDAMREREISAPFTLYPREAFLSLWKADAGDMPALLLSGIEHTRSFCHWRTAVIRLLSLVGYLSHGATVREYENQISPDYKCDDCRALLRRVARAGYRAERERAA